MFQTHVKKADLFSRPFSFSVGLKDKKKKTVFGGALSLGVIIISIIYFIYLIQLYFSKKLLPKVSKENIFSNDSNTLVFQKSLFKFNMRVDGISLAEYEAKKGKKYLKYAISYERYEVSKTPIFDQIPLKLCEEENYTDFYCMDIEKMTEQQRTLTTNPIKQIQSNYSILIQKCIGDPDCAAESDIDDLMNQYESFFMIYTSIQQFNSSTQEFVENEVLDYYAFDSLIFMEVWNNLKKSVTTVKTGLLVQSDDSHEHVIEFSKQNRNIAYQNSLTSFKFAGFAYLGYRMDQYYQENIVQYPMITEVLTQFSTVFNMLLMVGILANMVADSDIIHDLKEIWLKEYYKFAALRLIDIPEQREEDSPRKQDDQKYSERLQIMKDQIMGIDFIGKSIRQLNLSFTQRLKMIFLGESQAKANEQKKSMDIYNEMTEITAKTIDIAEVFRDLIRIKMTLKLMLSEDQFAAIQFCGRDISEKENEKSKVNTLNLSSKIYPEKQKNKQINSTNRQLSPGNSQNIVLEKSKINENDSGLILQSNIFHENENHIYTHENRNQRRQKFFHQFKRVNHLEQIDKIEGSSIAIKENLEIFLKRVQSSNSISQVDRNIYYSLLGDIWKPSLQIESSSVM